MEVNLLDKYPKSNRPIEERFKSINGEIRQIARKFDKEFFDGDRLYGYGGYKYNTKYWTETVKRFKDYYKLNDACKILDVGCAKGFMMYDFKKLMPNCKVFGVDISEYAYENAMEDMKPFIKIASADELPFEDNYFDLVISINTIHNLEISRCKKALKEIQRVSKKNCFITVDSWTNEKEKEKMEMWNLTAKTYMHREEWINLFNKVGYDGDYYWFIP